MAVAIGGHLLLAPASIAAGAVATMLSLVLVRLAQQTAHTRALRTLTLVVSHADKWLHKAARSTSSRARRRRCASSRWRPRAAIRLSAGSVSLIARWSASNSCPTLTWVDDYRANYRIMPTNGDYPWERDERAAKKRPPASSGSDGPAQGPVWSASAAKKLSLPAKRRRPKRSWRLRRSRGRSFSGSRQPGRTRALACICLLLSAAALAQQLGVNTPGGIGVNHTTLSGAYVAIQGPWRYRWVRVVNPPPGTPAYVRQRYRTIRYVAAAP
jgi:hypothetical protein